MVLDIGGYGPLQPLEGSWGAVSESGRLRQGAGAPLLLARADQMIDRVMLVPRSFGPGNA